MNSDAKIMKTALFGGFKKTDVLSYIEQLQKETADIKEQLDTKRQEAMELKNLTMSLEDKLDSLNKVNEQLREREMQIAELTAKLSASEAENTQYRERIKTLDEKSDRLRRAEKQIGAAYIDARRYSDELVDNAKNKAKDIGAIASQDVKREASEIEQLLKDVDAISRKFNSSLEQLHKDVYALGTKLNSSAAELLNLHTDLTALGADKFDIDAETSEIDDDTIISYPNSVDFFDTKEG